MINLSARQFEIIKKLVDSEKLSADDICREYEISKRTVYREIGSINKAIESYGLLVCNSPKGLVIDGGINSLEKLKIDLLGLRPSPNAEKRKTLILSELLQSKEPLKLGYFAKKYGVSSATISYDLRNLNNWLNTQGLSLIAKPGYGVIVEGSESDFRKAIVDFLYENTETETLIEFLNKSNVSISNKNGIENYLMGIIEKNVVSAIEKSVAMLAERLDFNIAESSYMGLIIHLALAVKRIQSGEKIDIDAAKLRELKDTEEYEYATILADFLEDELKIRIPEDEIGYITIHLRGARYRANTGNTVDSGGLDEMVDSMIDMAERIFGMGFKDDELLKSGLLTHLEPALYRLSAGLAIRNPLINDIKTKYTDLFNNTKTICKILEKEIKEPIPDDEIGYIAMHFGAAIERKEKDARKYKVLAVCASGIGTSRMMLSKLQLFPQINVVGAVSSMKIDEAIKDADIDLIISTIPIETEKVKSITVNPLLLDDDIEKIKKALNTDLIMNRDFARNHIEPNFDAIHIARYGKHLLNLLENIDLAELNGRHSEDIIEELLSGLTTEGLIKNKNKIKNRLLDRESLGRIVLPGRAFVIYHCTTDEVTSPIIAVGRLTSKISMKNLLNEDEDIKTAFLMLAPENDKEGIEIMGDMSVSLIEDNTLVENINKAMNKFELKNIIEGAAKKKYLDEIRRVVS